MPDEPQNPLPNDDDTPFSPPTNPDDDLDMTGTDGLNKGGVNETHPATDSNVDSHEAYDEGVQGGSEENSDADEERGV